MSIVAGLFDAIRRNPEDRLPWLVLADWIEEQGYSTDAARVRADAAGDRGRTRAADGWEIPLPDLSADCWCELVAGLGVTREARIIDLTGRGLAEQARPIDLFPRDPAERVTDRGL